MGADGKTSTVKTTFNYYGKDYPVTGSPDFDSVNAHRIDANTIESTQKLMGKDVGVTRRTVSADGKTLTLHQRRTTANRQEVSTLMVYDVSDVATIALVEHHLDERALGVDEQGT